MAEVKYGQVNWDESSVSTGSDFMNLEKGDNNVRIFTNPYQFIVHWVKDSSGVNRKIKCAIEDCPLCKKGVKAQYRWYLGVLDRSSDNQPKILEISSQVLIAIKNYISDKRWGDVKLYDINIKRNPPKSNPLYDVLPDPNKGPISAEEKVHAKLFLERIDVNKFTQPSTPEEIAEKLGTSLGSTNNTPVQYVAGNKAVTNEGSRPVISENDFNFGEDL
ncbi:MAG: hypothetical protein WC516_05465 [Patescibacteria group bacterium]|jgi:hypothetical protein